MPLLMLPIAAIVGVAFLIAQAAGGIDAGGGPWSALNTLLLVVLAVSQQRIKRKVECTEEDILDIADIVIDRLQDEGAFGRRRPARKKAHK